MARNSGRRGVKDVAALRDIPQSFFMKTFIPSRFAAFFSLLVVTCTLAAQTSDDNLWETKNSQEAQAEAQARIEKIRNEIKSLNGHPWAGEYYHGDGLGVNVSFYIAPDAGFVFEWRGCLGLYDRNYGTVSFENDLVSINPILPNRRGAGFEGIAMEFLPVFWGKRVYMVPSDEVVKFCNDINSEREPRKEAHGFFLLRRGDEKVEVTGFPVLPEKYRPYILKKPVRVTVISVGESETKAGRYGGSWIYTTVTVMAGSKQGLLPGMRMYLVNPEHVSTGLLEVVEVSATSAKVLVRRDADSKYDQALQAGWQLATCPSYARALKKYSGWKTDTQ